MKLNRILPLFEIMAVALVASSCLGQHSAELPSLDQRLSDSVYMSWMSNKDAAQCIECHLFGLNPILLESDYADRLTEFSRRSEMMHWIQSDKHTIARRRIEPLPVEPDELVLTKRRFGVLIASQQLRVDAALRTEGRKLTIDPNTAQSEWNGDSNKLSRRICDKMWGAGWVDTEKGYADFRQNCLSCHGGHDPSQTDAIDDKGDASLFGFTFSRSTQLGIDCLYCHSEGNGERGWINAHRDVEEWRLRDPIEKASKFGMRDLVNVKNQADMCFDCHIGNRKKSGMFVTHQMYAAGHPPLPSIELHKFCEEMPRHWQTPATLNTSLTDVANKNEYFRVNYPGVVTKSGPSADADQVFWNTRKVLIGALVARRKTLQLYIDIASDSPDDWGDYALYDCSACHHELKTTSQRQLRGLVGAPGRPRQNEWPLVLLTAAGDVAKASDGLSQHEIALANCFAEQPFGRMDDVRVAATALIEDIEQQLRGLEKTPFNAGTADSVLRSLLDTSPNEFLTYDGARQLVWAIETVVHEFETANVAQSLKLAPEARKLADSLGEPITVGINSELPSGRHLSIYPDYLKNNLAERAEFDSGLVRQHLQTMKAALR